MITFIIGLNWGSALYHLITSQRGDKLVWAHSILGWSATATLWMFKIGII